MWQLFFVVVEISLEHKLHVTFLTNDQSGTGGHYTHYCTKCMKSPNCDDRIAFVQQAFYEMLQDTLKLLATAFDSS